MTGYEFRTLAGLVILCGGSALLVVALLVALVMAALR
jgi:hypothetical protein